MPYPAISVTYAHARAYDRFAALIHSFSPSRGNWNGSQNRTFTHRRRPRCVSDDSNRYELIEGELFVSRAPGIPHQRVLNNLLFAFESYVKENPIGIVVPGARAVFSDYDAVIPDLAFVRNVPDFRLSVKSVFDLSS
jgi:hypothetical protein